MCQFHEFWQFFWQLVLQEHEPQSSRTAVKVWGKCCSCNMLNFFQTGTGTFVWNSKNVHFQNKDGGFLVRDSSKAGKYTVSLFAKSGAWVNLWKHCHCLFFLYIYDCSFGSVMRELMKRRTVHNESGNGWPQRERCKSFSAKFGLISLQNFFLLSLLVKLMYTVVNWGYTVISAQAEVIND